MNNNTATLSIDEEKQRAIAEIDRKAQIAKEHQLKLGQLTKAVTIRENALVEFESKKQFLQQRKAQLEAQVLQLWPAVPSDKFLQVNTSPVQSMVECFGTIFAIDLAMADAPRAKRHLDSELHTAKQALADFQQRQK